MKPKKRIMCPECWKPKILFETEEKALNFIKFNGDLIDSHGRKLRPYYCKSCDGYHVTSKAYNKKFEGRTEKLIGAYERDKKVIMDELEKKEATQKKFNKFVDKIYNGFMRNISIDNLSTYIKLHYPNISESDEELILKRLNKRQNFDSVYYWKNLTNTEKDNIIQKIILRAINLNATEKKEVLSIMKSEFKLVPIGCASTIYENLNLVKKSEK